MSEHPFQNTPEADTPESGGHNPEEEALAELAEKIFAFAVELNQYAAHSGPSGPAPGEQADVHTFEVTLQNLKDELASRPDTQTSGAGFRLFIGALTELAQNNLGQDAVGKEAKIFACERLRDHFGMLATIVREGVGRHIYDDYSDVGSALRAVGTVLETSRTYTLPKLFVPAYDFLETNMDSIAQAIRADKDAGPWEFAGKRNNYAEALLPILKVGFRFHPLAGRAAGLAAEIYTEQIRKHDITVMEDAARYLLNSLMVSGGSGLDRDRQEEVFLYEVLRTYDVSPDDFYRRWQDSTYDKPEQFSLGVQKNLLIMQELARQCGEKAIAYLKDHFGIYDFGRYPSEILARQYKTRDVVDAPYGIILNPAGDQDGAFYNDYFLWRELGIQLSDLEPPIILRVTEADNKREVGRLALSLAEKYGAARFGIIGGHGNRDGITLGRGGGMYRLELQDAEGKGVQRAGRRLFEEGATIILNTCHGGDEEESIGKRFAAKTDFAIIGANTATSIKTIEVEIRDNKPHFTVEYHEPHATRIHKKA